MVYGTKWELIREESGFWCCLCKKNCHIYVEMLTDIHIYRALPSRYAYTLFRVVVRGITYVGKVLLLSKYVVTTLTILGQTKIIMIYYELYVTAWHYTLVLGIFMSTCSINFFTEPLRCKNMGRNQCMSELPLKTCLMELEERSDIDMDCDHVKFCMSWFTVWAANIVTTLAVESWNEHPIPDTAYILTCF